MARSVLSAGSGRLRLPRDVLDCFATWGPDLERMPSSARTDLEAAGIVAGGDLHPFVATVAGCIREPEFSLSVATLFPVVTASGGWCCEGAVVLSLPTVEDDLFEIVVLPEDGLPRALAHLIGLGPRPPGEVNLEIPLSIWDEATHRAGEPRGPAPIGADRSAALASVKGRWVIEAFHLASGTGRRLDIADLGDRGWHLARASDQGESVELTPVTATDIWGLLTSLLD